MPERDPYREVPEWERKAIERGKAFGEAMAEFVMKFAKVFA